MYHSVSVPKICSTKLEGCGDLSLSLLSHSLCHTMTKWRYTSNLKNSFVLGGPEWQDVASENYLLKFNLCSKIDYILDLFSYTF